MGAYLLALLIPRIEEEDHHHVLYDAVGVGVVVVVVAVAPFPVAGMTPRQTILLLG
jgi:hypothetical protein